MIRCLSSPPSSVNFATENISVSASHICLFFLGSFGLVFGAMRFNGVNHFGDNRRSEQTEPKHNTRRNSSSSFVCRLWKFFDDVFICFSWSKRRARLEILCFFDGKPLLYILPGGALVFLELFSQIFITSPRESNVSIYCSREVCRRGAGGGTFLECFGWSSSFARTFGFYQRHLINFN